NNSSGNIVNSQVSNSQPQPPTQSLQQQHQQQRSHDSSVVIVGGSGSASSKPVAAAVKEFILGSPSKDPTTKSKPLSQFTKTTTTTSQVQSVTATTPTSNSQYNSCNSSPVSTPTSAAEAANTQTSSGTTTSSTTQNPPRRASYTNVASTPATQTQTTTTKSTAVGSSGRYDELLEWKDMPKYLQFNPYVINGYRPLTTFKGCLLSLFYWHNETINILTHAIPIFYILAVVPGLMPWENGYRFLSFCHVFGSLAPWCGSFVYHLFMNIEKGEDVYYRLLKLDMVGIWVSQSFGALPLVTATTLCFTFKWKWCIIISYCLLSLWGLYKALTASSPWQRRLCFALPFTMRSILTFLRTIGIVGSNRIAMSHVYLQDGVSILGGAIGAMRIPEKWFPGLVDYYLNSHNIMHVLVVVAVYSMHQATVRELAWMSTAQCGGSINATNEIIDSTSSLDANAEL
ncbi:progestin and adipoQ receptor family member 4, partial [Eupeodes corollae]|uniref:progestin and adipoQ receptor family member 4 n=1 Tax=Eupeodes corollae TaxID=290404 RepID=UPI0024924D4F